MDLPKEAAAYARADFSAVNAAFVERLLEVAGDRREARAIDLGTGPGDIAIRVALARLAWCVTALDASDAMLVIAREAASADGANVEFVRGDAKATCLPGASFDVVFSNSLLHHMPDPLPLWREIARMAAPNAVIFLRDLIRPATEGAARRIVEQYATGESELLKEEFHRSLLAAFTADEIREQLRATGLEYLSLQPSSDRHVDVFGVARA